MFILGTSFAFTNLIIKESERPIKIALIETNQEENNEDNALEEVEEKNDKKDSFLEYLYKIADEKRFKFNDSRSSKVVLSLRKSQTNAHDLLASNHYASLFHLLKHLCFLGIIPFCGVPEESLDQGVLHLLPG